MLFLLLNAVGVAIQGASFLSLVSAMLPGDAAGKGVTVTARAARLAGGRA
jgi:hypothetical protein